MKTTGKKRSNQQKQLFELLKKQNLKLKISHRFIHI